MARSRLLQWCGSSRFCRETLEELYACYNRSEFIHPDPLEFVHQYPDPLDREVVAMVASSLAYGRVQQILRSVSVVLDCMGETPSRFVMEQSSERLRKAFEGFRHRFTGGDQLAGLLCGIGQAIRRHGSLQACFLTHHKRDDDSVLPALTAFVQELATAVPGETSMLLPSPTRGSACKRLNLFLRWMVRTDDVDPGGWSGVNSGLLIVPLDTHMHRISLEAGLTRRKQADMQTALEVTRFFKTIAPDDPVRYDFALTRLGIRGIENE
jgi:uncharacterized protein (TIGR02757 family)